MKQRMPALIAGNWQANALFLQDYGGKPDLLDAGINNIKIAGSNYPSMLLKVLDETSYDCITVFDYPDIVSIIRKKFHGPICYEIHTPIKKNLLKADKDVFKLVSKVIVPSRWSKQWVLQYYPSVDPEKIVVCGNCVDSSIFFPASGAHSEAKEVVWVGKFGHYKNWKEALEILCILSCEHKDTKITWITGAHVSEKNLNYFLKILAKCKLYDRVQWLHNLPHYEMGELFRKAALKKAVLLSTSLHESFCLIVHEAMRCGLPVVASKVGAVPEVITHGMSGMLYRPGNIKEAMSLLSEMIERDTLRKIVISGAYESIKAFDSEKLLKRYIEIVESQTDSYL